MGEAKRRTGNGRIAYHHTSTLRTNLIWMSGVIEVEGQGQMPIHPQLGPITTSPFLRRNLKDFPALAWFTTRRDVPRCLLNTRFILSNVDTGEHIVDQEIGSQISNALALNRVALGFQIFEVPLVHWPKHAGYRTPEGRALNLSATDAGDNLDDWYVSETPVDLMKISEFWRATKISDTTLQRWDAYIADIRRMVTLCRSGGVYIPPSWITGKQAAALSKSIAVPVRWADGTEV